MAKGKGSRDTDSMMPAVSRKPSVRISMDDPRGMNSMSVNTDKMSKEDMKVIREVMGRCMGASVTNKGKK